MNEIAKARPLEVIGAEIRALTQQGRCITLLYGIEIGRRLREAHEQLKHGEWLPFLERETDFSSSSAARYMKVYEEYGAAQLSIFGAEPNFPTLGNLSMTNALKLLAVPAEEREEFVEANDVENLSVRELDKLLQEKAAAEEAAARAREEADQAADAALAAEMAARAAKEELERERENAEGAAIELGRLREENRELKARPVAVTVERDEAAIQEAARTARTEEAAQWQDRLSGMRQELERAKAAGDEAVRAAEAKKDELQKKLDKAKAQAEKYKAEAAQAAGSAQEQADAARKEAEEKAAALEREAALAREELERARKELSLSSPEAAVFRERFTAAQKALNDLIDSLLAVRAQVPDLGEKFTAALRAVLEQFAERIGGEGHA